MIEMDDRQRKIIAKHWENYSGTSLNLIYRGEDFQLVASDNLERPSYNRLIPENLDSDIRMAADICSHIEWAPALYGEKEFIEEYRQRNFPDTELERTDRWMRFTGEKPDKKSFEGLDFTWITEEGTDDYLDVLQQVFGAPDSYIDLHRDPVKEYGKEAFRLVFYRDDMPVSIGELRINAGDAFIYSLATLEEEQGGGLATEVLRKLLVKAQDSEVDNIYLLAEDTDWLVDFYKERGFEVDFTVVSYKGGEWDRIFET